MSSIVYVVQNHGKNNPKTGLVEPRFDLSPAEQYGELVFLLSSISVPNYPADAIAELRKKLRNFSDKDYLLLVGNPCFIGWAVAIASDMNEGRVSLLQYNGRKKKYFSIQSEGLIDFEN